MNPIRGELKGVRIASTNLDALVEHMQVCSESTRKAAGSFQEAMYRITELSLDVQVTGDVLYDLLGFEQEQLSI